MSQLEMNGVSSEVNPSLHTWRDLLFDLESRQLGAGEVIASVKFNGDEILHFREDDVLSRLLKPIQQIRIEAVAMKELARGALEEAEHFLKSLETSMVDVAESFRTGLPEPASFKLQQLLEGIKMLSTLARGIELSVGGDRKTDSGVEQTLESLGPALVELISAQEKHDWTLVADILEYELLAYFSSFEQVLNGLGNELGVREDAVKARSMDAV